MKKLCSIFIIMLVFCNSVLAEGRYKPKASHVTDNVYAFIGPLGQRSKLNDGLNNNIGFIITRSGVILIDSGASAISAKSIEQAIKKVTPKPVKWVINTGGQDHRWLGNGYFQQKGAQTIALTRTVDTQNLYATQQMESLKRFLGERLKGTKPSPAQKRLSGDRVFLSLDGIKLVLQYTDAHYPGDSWVWYPDKSVIFTGDLVYVDRLVGFFPQSSVVKAHSAFLRMEKLQPKYIVPGHGRISDLKKARKDCGDYYDFLVHKIGAAAQNMDSMQETLDQYANLKQFKHLQNYSILHKPNMSRAFLEFEQQ